jgi:hypothetical protein
VCKVLRIFDFLNSFGLINYNCRTETRSATDPTTILHATDDYRDLIKQKSSPDATVTSRWSIDADNLLLLSVKRSYGAMDNSKNSSSSNNNNSSSSSSSSSSSKLSVDWSTVASLMNRNSASVAGSSEFTALDCASRFIEMDLTEQPLVNLRPNLLRKELLPVREASTAVDRIDVLRLIKNLSQSTSQEQVIDCDRC